MIYPEEDDIGRAVVYTGNRYPGGLSGRPGSHGRQDFHQLPPR
jgi:hypothetical protein